MGCQQRRGRRWPASQLARRMGPALCCGVLSLAAALPAAGQVTEGLPHRSYFLAVEELYSGDHRSAARLFRRDLNRGIRVGTTRWVDSICYFAMQGEVQYQLGNNADALAYFDQACQLFLQHPGWLLRVKFQSPPREDTNLVRQGPPPWGQSQRQAILGELPDQMLVFHGRIQTAEEFQRQQGPVVVETPQFFSLQVPEIVRCTALAIRRRNEILGPLGKYDRISKDLVETLAGGGLAPPNHWSGAWVELQLALAQIGVGNVQEAHTHLSRALVLDGRFDHPLTCVVLLEQGRLALEAGNGPLAARLLAEASFSAFYYDNWNVLDESLRLGQLNHLISAAPGVYPPLDTAAQWARRKGLRLLTANFRVAQAENLAALGQTNAAAAALEDATRWLGNMAAGRSGTRHRYVQAIIGFAGHKIEPAEKALADAVARQAATSLRGFQLQRTNLMFDGSDVGRISSRVAVDLYRGLLDDPTPEDWAHRPLDTLAMMSSPLAESFDRWFLATLDRKEILQAVQISELAKRRRFYAALPWGGRLLALRALLEAPAVELSNDAALQRQRIMTDFPTYAELSAAGTQFERQLAGRPVLAEAQAEQAELTELYKSWQKNVAAREELLRVIGASRQPVPLLVPPRVNREQLQSALSDGQVVLLFHSVAGQLHGFVIARENYNHWQLGRARNLQKDLAQLLREMGNYGPGRTLALEDLANDRWKETAHDLFVQLLGDSRLEVDKSAELIIVPDDLLWYLPFEALVPAKEKEAATLTDLVRIRYAPTVGLALDGARPLRRVQRTGIVATGAGPETQAEFFRTEIDRLAAVVRGPVRLPARLPVPAPLVSARLEQLVSLDDIEPEPAAPLDWSPLPRDRGRTGGLGVLVGLPWTGPERVVLAGFTTKAENGLKGATRRNDAATAPPGSELFNASCGLMASGARTVLLSRWRTGGQTNLGLVREFMQELPHVPATEAWQRAVLVARATPLDPGREPRLKPADETAAQPPTADHPFFWAGYMLLDNSGNPDQLDDEAPAGDTPVVRFKEDKK